MVGLVGLVELVGLVWLVWLVRERRRCFQTNLIEPCVGNLGW